MAFPNTAPNRTRITFRRKGGDVHLRQYQIDPAYGIPPGTPPLAVDAVNGLVRPFSSFATVAAAVAGFVGFAWDNFVVGEDHSIWVHTEGWWEAEVATPAVVMAGDYFSPTLDSGGTFVSNDFVVPSTGVYPDDPLAKFRAVKSCICQPSWDPVVCPTDPAAPADASATTAIGRQLQRTVLLYFNSDDCCEPTGA